MHPINSTDSITGWLISHNFLSSNLFHCQCLNQLNMFWKLLSDQKLQNLSVQNQCLCECVRCVCEFVCVCLWESERESECLCLYANIWVSSVVCVYQKTKKQDLSNFTSSRNILKLSYYSSTSMTEHSGIKIFFWHLDNRIQR